MAHLAQNEVRRNHQSLAARSIAKEDRVCARSSPEDITAQRASAEDSWRPLPLEEIRQQHIRRVLDAREGNRCRAAQLLGIGRTSLYRFLKRSEKKLGLASTHLRHLAATDAPTGAGKLPQAFRNPRTGISESRTDCVRAKEGTGRPQMCHCRPGRNRRTAVSER